MNIKKIINYVLILIFLILFIVLQYFIIKLDVLPQKYYLLLTIIEALLAIITILFSFLKNKIFNIISIILSILLIIINSFGIYYVKHLDKFIEKGFTGDIVNLSTFYLISSKDNQVNSIDDITLDKPVNYYVNSVNNDKAREKLGNYIYEEVNNLSSYLENNKNTNNYLLLDKINYSLYSELNPNNNYKVIYEFDIKTVEKRNFEVKDTYNVLIIGKDFVGRDDLNIIVTINNKTHQVLLTGMTRDLYIDAVGYNFKDTVSSMHALGEDVVVKSLENYFDTTIDFKVSIYTNNLVKLVDTIGGVEFCSTVNFRTTHAKVLGTYDDSKGEKMYVKKGCREYSGIEILTIARERIAFNPKGDHQRQENCRQILTNIVKKVASISTLSNYSEILDSLSGLFTTNMNRNTMAILVRNALNNPNYEIIESYVGGEQTYNAPLGIERWKGSAIYPNEKEAINARAKIKEILNNY